MRDLSKHRGYRAAPESGFTLPELMIVIILMGILAAIAIPSWQAIIDSRNVTTATRQMNADIRLAHDNSVNQLTDWRVVFRTGGAKVTNCNGSADYCLVKLADSYSGGATAPTISQRIPRTLPEGTRINASSVSTDGSGSGTVSPSVNGQTRTIELNTDGTGTIRAGAAYTGPNPATVTLSTTSGGSQQTISFNAATSRVEFE